MTLTYKGWGQEQKRHSYLAEWQRKVISFILGISFLMQKDQLIR